MGLELFGYSDAEWSETTAGRPLRRLSHVDLYLLFTRWAWRSTPRRTSSRPWPRRQSPEEAAGIDAPKYLFVWVRRGLLWALVEALTDKREGRCVLPGRLGEDVAALAEPLKLTRNAVFHIPRPREPYPDTRLVALMTGTESGARVKRVHDGLGRLIGDELNQRPEYRSGEGRALSGSVEAGDGLRVAVRRFADADPVEVDVNAEVTSPLVRLDRPR